MAAFTDAIRQASFEQTRENVVQRMSIGLLRPTLHPPLNDQPYVGFAVIPPEPLDPSEDDRYFIGQDGALVLCDFHSSCVVPIILTVEEAMQSGRPWLVGMEVLLGRIRRPRDIVLLVR